jgi:hypothetical protein
MPGWPARPILLNLKMANSERGQLFSTSSLAAAIETFDEIAVVAPPGIGKTTTLLQMVEAVLARGHSLAVFIPLKEWRVQTETVFQFILRRHAFRDVQEAELKMVAQRAQLVLAMDGWNELDPDSRKRARLEIAALRREFPDLGIVVSTRRQSLDVPISGRRVEIDRLTESQQPGDRASASGFGRREDSGSRLANSWHPRTSCDSVVPDYSAQACARADVANHEGGGAQTVRCRAGTWQRRRRIAA